MNCPVREDCARPALYRGGQSGMWGGPAEQERQEA
ncbi:WhiB family transcriptional regulator [Streptomyces sp. NPDC059629]